MEIAGWELADQPFHCEFRKYYYCFLLSSEQIKYREYTESNVRRVSTYSEELTVSSTLAARAPPSWGSGTWGAWSHCRRRPRRASSCSCPAPSLSACPRTWAWRVARTPCPGSDPAHTWRTVSGRCCGQRAALGPWTHICRFIISLSQGESSSGFTPKYL